MIFSNTNSHIKSHPLRGATLFPSETIKDAIERISKYYYPPSGTTDVFLRRLLMKPSETIKDAIERISKYYYPPSGTTDVHLRSPLRLP